MARFDLSDDEWAVIQPLLPKQWRGPLRKNDRTILNGYFTFVERERLGVIYPADMGPTQLFTTDIPGGRNAVFGAIYLKSSRKNAKGL